MCVTWSLYSFKTKPSVSNRHNFINYLHVKWNSKERHLKSNWDKRDICVYYEQLLFFFLFLFLKKKEKISSPFYFFQKNDFILFNHFTFQFYSNIHTHRRRKSYFLKFREQKQEHNTHLKCVYIYKINLRLFL